MCPAVFRLARSRIQSLARQTSSRPARLQDRFGTFWDMLAFRFIFTVDLHGRWVITSGLLAFRQEYGALAGLLFAFAVILFELRLRKASLRRLIGAATGSILGILGAYLISLIFTHTTMPESTRSFFSLAVFLVMTYIGLVLGANKGDMLNLQAFGGVFGSERNTKHSFKLLDTSVIIDGRVARHRRRAVPRRHDRHSAVSFCASCSWWPIRPTR